jgi:hypothetical protein
MRASEVQAGQVFRWNGVCHELLEVRHPVRLVDRTYNGPARLVRTSSVRGEREWLLPDDAEVGLADAG